MSGRRAWTIRRDSLVLWQGLVLQDMGEVDFHVSGKYWKLTSSPNTSKLVLGPPDWSSHFFESQGTISGAIKPINFPKHDPQQKKGNWKTAKQTLCVDKVASSFMPFIGPHGARDHMRPMLVNLGKLGFHEKLDLFIPFGN